MEKRNLPPLPDVQGVYLFRRGRKILYVGKATSLADRVRSYFDDDLISTRGPRIVDMVTSADRVTYETTPTVLEALIREALLIRKHQPEANAQGKDDSTFLYVGITDEVIPRVLTVRGKDLDPVKKASQFYAVTFSRVYGPFTSGQQLKEALRIIRRIFPFYDTDRPVDHASRHHEARIEFNRQIGQYPDAIDVPAYQRSIRRVALLLAGKGKELRRSLERDMQKAAQDEKFEKAALYRRQLFALNHLQDVSLIRHERERVVEKEEGRIEAYDTAHLAGTNAMGVMVVLQDGAPAKRQYRTFRIRNLQKNDDIASLKELLHRRFGHPEWEYPRAIVVDGGKAQKKAAENMMRELGLVIPVVAVVKDDRHRPRDVIGANQARLSEVTAVHANAEAHRFSLLRHRQARSLLRGKRRVL